MADQTPTAWWREPDFDALPPNTYRKEAPAVIKKHTGEVVSHRSLERWPLQWKRVNGKAITPTRELLAEAKRRLDTAPVIRGGHTAPASAAP